MALEPPAVTIDYRLAKMGIHLADGSFIKLSPTDLAFYGWLARRRKHLKDKNNSDQVQIPPESLTVDSKKHATCAKYLEEYRQEEARVNMPNDSRIGRELEQMQAMTYGFFHQRKTSIKECLEHNLGPLAMRYMIKRLTKKGPSWRFGLDIEPERIKFLED